MRLVFLLIALASACAAHAQVKPMVVRPPADDRDERDWRERERREHRRTLESSGTPPIMVVRPPAAPERDRDERRETRPATKMSPPASKPATAPLMVVRPAEPPATSSGNFRCSAYPVCDRSSGSYGSCRGVEQLYSAKSARFAREQVARDCAALNRPDSCNCAPQCSRVAQCGPI